MDAQAADLATQLISKYHSKAPTERLLVGISGIPASGKSTFAELIVKHLNNILSTSSATIDTPSDQQDQAVLIGLDGWHLTRAQLDAMPDPKLAKDRRGAHWTFDGNAYASFVHQLSQPLSPTTPIITAPSFDHSVKDPVYDSVSIYYHHRIVVIEGLYTFLSIDPWKEAGSLLDERVFLRIDLDEAETRLVKRHVKTGVAKDLEEAKWRADENDMPNGKFIMENMLLPTIDIRSVEDPVLTGV